MHRPALEPQRPGAESLQHLVVVTGRDHDSSVFENRVRAVGDDLAELVVERLVDLVEQQDVRVRALGDDEAEPNKNTYLVMDGPKAPDPRARFDHKTRACQPSATGR